VLRLAPRNLRRSMLSGPGFREFDNLRPLNVTDGHDAQTRFASEGTRLEQRMGFQFGERDAAREFGNGFDVNGRPNPALGGGIAVCRFHYLANSHDRLFLASVVDEYRFIEHHATKVVARLDVPHTIPTGWSA